MEIPSRVHGGFKITKHNRFSNVQKKLKPWLTMVAINFRTYLIVFPTDESKILFVISYFDGTAFNWVQPRLDFFFGKRKQKTKAKNATKVLQIRQFVHLHKKGFWQLK